MTTALSPSSLQLRLAKNCRTYKGLPPLLIRPPVRNRDCGRRLLCVARNEMRVERRRHESPLIVSSSAADNFAGWSDSKDEDESTESQRKKWLGGMVGAGIAGVVLVTGLTLAALSLSKRSVPRPTQQMEPLTIQQEALVVSDIKDDKGEYDRSSENNLMLDNASQENSKDLSSSPELNEPCDETELSPLANVNDASFGGATNDASVQEDLHHESDFDDASISPHVTHSSQNLPNPDLISEIKKDSVYVEPGELPHATTFEVDHNVGLPIPKETEDTDSLSASSILNIHEPSKHVAVSISVSSQLDALVEPQMITKDDTDIVAKENFDLSETLQVPADKKNSSPPLEVNYINEESSRPSSMPASGNPIANEEEIISDHESSGFPTPGTSFSFAGVPAPSAVADTLQVLPGKVLVPAVIDQVQGQALAALQVLKVIEPDIQPSDLCTRREYARWLVAASSVLSRNTMSKVYPAMYIEDVTELAFDDIMPDDPDFSFIQGLAEAGLISSKLLNRDLLSSSGEYQESFYFSPESPLSRQDLVSWKMALEKKQLPEPDRKKLYELSGFRDIDKINSDAWPALIADLSAGDQGIISLAFGCTRLFQPNKPVTKAQAAVALSTGEASDFVGEELARIEAESMAENAVSAHNALVAEVERDINASFEKELLVEREKINAVEKMAEEARDELERLRAEREKDNMALMKERAAIESEMEVLSRLRREVEDQLQSLLSDKVSISYEKDRISKLQKEAENEKQEISRLQYELEVERKALSMARTWAEDEAKRAQEQAKALEEARDRWERHGIKVIVDSDLREEGATEATWLNAGKQFSVEGTVSRAENLVDKLKLMAKEVRGKSREVIEKIMKKLLSLIATLKKWALEAGTQAGEIKDAALVKARGSIHELQQATTEFGFAIKEKTRGPIQGLQQTTSEFSLAVKDGAKRVAEDCRDGVEKLTHKFNHKS